MPRRRKPPRLYLRTARRGRPAQWVILDGSHESCTGAGPNDTREAEEALERYLLSKYEPPRDIVQPANLLVDDVVAIYLEEVAAHSESRDWLCTMVSSLLDWWSGKPLTSVKGPSCREYVAWRTSHTVKNAPHRYVSEQTARHELKALRAAINHYHAEHGPLAAVPTVSLPKRSPQRTDYWLTRDDVAARLRAAWRRPDARHVARLLLIGVYTGTRTGAILKLKWLLSSESGWIDLDAGIIHRRGSAQRRTRKKATPVRIHERLLPHLRCWKQADLAQGIIDVIHYRGQPIKKLRRSWATVGKHSNWSSNDAPHIVRHTAATWQMQAGTPLAEAAEYLGMTPETLWQEYGHHHPDFQRDAARATSKRCRPGNAQETRPSEGTSTPRKKG